MTDDRNLTHLRQAAKAPTTFPAWALREWLEELVERREADAKRNAERS